MLDQVQNGGQQALRDGANRPLPAMNGGVLGKIPFPNYAIPMAEYGWSLPPEKLRHNGAIHLGFLDGHAILIVAPAEQARLEVDSVRGVNANHFGGV